MGWIRCIRCKKFRRDFMARSFAQLRPFCTEFRKATKRSRMYPNSTRCTKTSVLGTMGWIGCVHCKKNPTRLRGTNFCTSSAHFALSFVRQPNGPECTQIVRNTPKRQFRVQWGGSGVFVAKNSDATSWHELCTSSSRFVLSFVRQPNSFQMHPNSTKRTKTSV